eukprot:Gb_14773 [translate_table: standard]
MDHFAQFPPDQSIGSLPLTPTQLFDDDSLQLHQHQGALCLLFDSRHTSGKNISSSTLVALGGEFWTRTCSSLNGDAPGAGGDAAALKSGELPPRLQREFGEVTGHLDQGLRRNRSLQGCVAPIEAFCSTSIEVAHSSIEVRGATTDGGGDAVKQRRTGTSIEVSPRSSLGHLFAVSNGGQNIHGVLLQAGVGQADGHMVLARLKHNPWTAAQHVLQERLEKQRASYDDIKAKAKSA